MNGSRLGTLFAQPWWLDAVAPGEWDEITVERGGVEVARMPFVLRKRLGFTFLVMPQLTQCLGPAFAFDDSKYATELSRQHEYMNELIDSLPQFDYFSHQFSPQISNWLPFYWKGFEQTTRYTYVLDDLSDLDLVWNGMRSSVRRAIRKARRNVSIRIDRSLDEFIDLNNLTFERQGMSPPYPESLVRRLDAACSQRDRRRILFAEDENGQLHAALYLVWDSERAYYLMGGADPELRNSGASNLLMWEAIQFASTVSKTFDFEGSMLEPIERFFRGFGAKQVPYLRITKVNSRILRVGLYFAEPFAAILGRRFVQATR